MAAPATVSPENFKKSRRLPLKLLIFFVLLNADGCDAGSKTSQTSDAHMA
ncbi:MAG: hypothetical protein ACK5KU_00100 [Beutenbergiaceae bacterium]